MIQHVLNTLVVVTNPAVQRGAAISRASGASSTRQSASQVQRELWSEQRSFRDKELRGQLRSLLVPAAGVEQCTSCAAKHVHQARHHTRHPLRKKGKKCHFVLQQSRGTPYPRQRVLVRVPRLAVLHCKL